MDGKIDYLARQLNAMKPGQRLTVPRHEMSDIPGNWLTGESGFDRLMEKVIGSAWEFRHSENPMTLDVTFERIEGDDKRRFVSADRRHLYVKRGEEHVFRGELKRA